MDTNNKSNVMFGVQDFTRPPPNFSNLPQHYPGFKTDNSNKDSMNWNPKDNFPVRLGSTAMRKFHSFKETRRRHLF